MGYPDIRYRKDGLKSAEPTFVLLFLTIQHYQTTIYVFLYQFMGFWSKISLRVYGKYWTITVLMKIRLKNIILVLTSWLPLKILNKQKEY